MTNNSWINFIKTVSTHYKISYSEALKNPNVKEYYNRVYKSQKKKSQKKKKKK